MRIDRASNTRGESLRTVVTAAPLFALKGHAMVADSARRYDEMLDALARGESLPISCYTDPAFASLELERIFHRTWQYVGPLRELTGVGDFITGFVGNVPVVVVRNADGLAGFVNVCRHRRHLVMEGRGCSTVMQCGYHAWTYTLSGALKTAPRSQGEPNFDVADYPLLPARTETLGPWVFVNLDLDARPLAWYFGGVLDTLAETGLVLGDLQLRQREAWESGTNWKTMLENFLECYHCAIAHPGFSAVVDVRPENYELRSFEWYLSQVGHERETAQRKRPTSGSPHVREGLRGAQYHLLWPNTTISVNPGFPNLEIDVWTPNGPNRTKGFSEYYFGPGVPDLVADSMIAFNKKVGDEDHALTASVQLGMLSGRPETGRFLTGAEHLAIDFLRLVVKGVAD